MELKKISKPVHEHDCESCIYLGTYSNHRFGGKDEHFDCYWCGKDDHPNLSSVLGRFGSSGPEYASSHPPEAFAMKQDYFHVAQAWYLFAMLQATRMGLYKPSACQPITYADAKK